MLTDLVFAVSDRRIAIYGPQSEVSRYCTRWKGKFELKTVRNIDASVNFWGLSM